MTMATLSQVRANTAPDPGVAGMRLRTASVAAIAVAYIATLSAKAPSMPTPASSRPPTAGPTMRLALAAPTSNAMAVAMRSRPTTSPIIVRRSGLSVAQPQPLMKLATANCQTSSVPVKAMRQSPDEVTASRPTTPASVRRRSKRSAKAPTKAPNRPMGSRRSMVTSATVSADPVWA